MGGGPKYGNYKQRMRVAKGGMKDYMEGKAAEEKPPPFKGEVICKKCGFKARYQFIRCPHCNEVQK
ncbi:MAG: hypothetical protein HZB65_04620 [Candidatus Aenigmarchaeota archaeon]|nr:hypothetical protein [Candidatus Aenigmarchaeota archaeon]